MRGLGESRPNTCGENTYFSHRGCDYFYAAHAIMLDRPYVGQRTHDVLAVLELRISLETESAGLAALRRSEEHLQAMRQALDDFERNVTAAGDTVSPDFRFHLQIAQATGNPYFADIMTHLGTTIIPRTRVNAIRNHDRRGEYLSRVNREHEEIYAAVARRDPDSARAAMRIHLTNSRERLRMAQAAAQRGAAEEGVAPMPGPGPRAA